VAVALDFWKQQELDYLLLAPLLAPLACDLDSRPASEAFQIGFLQLAGMLSAGRQNCMTISLECAYFLNLN
jgi:hypothetical protein